MACATVASFQPQCTKGTWTRRDRRCATTREFLYVETILAEFWLLGVALLGRWGNKLAFVAERSKATTPTQFEG